MDLRGNGRLPFYMTVLPVLGMVCLLFREQTCRLFEMLVVAPIVWWLTMLSHPYTTWVYPTLFVVGLLWWLPHLTLTWTMPADIRYNIIPEGPMTRRVRAR